MGTPVFICAARQAPPFPHPDLAYKQRICLRGEKALLECIYFAYFPQTTYVCMSLYSFLSRIQAVLFRLIAQSLRRLPERSFSTVDTFRIEYPPLWRVAFLVTKYAITKKG
jgi:hypothetical protein